MSLVDVDSHMVKGDSNAKNINFVIIKDDNSISYDDSEFENKFT